MEKLLIHLYVPALMRDFDVFMPQDVPISRMIQMLTNGLVQLSQGKYAKSGLECLALSSSSAPFYPDKTLNDYGIQDGEVIFLI